jgi:hypothetical protein
MTRTPTLHRSRAAAASLATALFALLALTLPAPSPAGATSRTSHDQHPASRTTHQKRAHAKRHRKHKRKRRSGRTRGAGGEERQAGLVVIPRSSTNPDLSYLKLGGSAGQTLQAGGIELVNPGEETMRVALAPVDGRTLDTLGSSYEPSGSALHGSTRWLALGARNVALAPHEHRLIEVAMRVPSTAKPGDTLTGVSVEELGQDARVRAAGRGASTASVARYAIGVEVSLAGKRQPLIRFTGASVQRDPAGPTFELAARNAGNVILQGVRGSVRVLRGKRTVLSRAIPAGTFLAGTSISYPVPAPNERPAEGTRYRVQATLRYPGGVARLNKTVTFGHAAAVVAARFGGPAAGGGGGDWWKLALIALAALYCLVTTAMLLRRRGRGAASGAA